MKNRYAKVNKRGKKILKHENKNSRAFKEKKKTQTKLTLAFETSITAWHFFTQSTTILGHLKVLLEQNSHFKSLIYTQQKNRRKFYPYLQHPSSLTHCSAASHLFGVAAHNFEIRLLLLLSSSSSLPPAWQLNPQHLSSNISTMLPL